MWSDTLLRAEQQHLLQLLLWAALSVISGTGVATMMAIRRVQSPLLKHFGIQMTAWGLVVAAIAAFGWFTAQLRDVSGAARLEHVAWMNIGLDAGYVAVGAALALTGWIIARRMAVVGAGVGVVVQGLALLVIDLHFASVISR